MSLEEKRKLAQCIATILEEVPQKKKEYFFGYADALIDVRSEKEADPENPMDENAQVEM